MMSDFCQSSGEKQVLAFGFSVINAGFVRYFLSGKYTECAYYRIYFGYSSYFPYLCKNNYLN